MAPGKIVNVSKTEGSREKVVDKVGTALVDKSNSKLTPVLLLVYGEHCGHCHAFENDWKRVSTELSVKTGLNCMALEAGNLSSSGKSTPISVPDGASMKEKVAKHSNNLVDHLSNNVFSVPYIAIWTPDGSSTKLSTERTPENIVQFVHTSLAKKVKT